MTLTAALPFVLTLFAAMAGEQNRALTVATDQARDALRQGSFGAAEEALAQVVGQAQTEGDTVSAARALFFLGLSKQQRAETVTGEEAVRLRNEALEHYQRSLELYPRAGAVLNNIAEIEEALGHRDRAKQALEEAIELGDARRSAYAFQLGELEEKDGNFNNAAKCYSIAMDTANPPPNVEGKLIHASIASGKKVEELIGVLWSLEKKSSGVETALDGALRALENDVASGEERDALFGIVADALAKQNYTLSQLVDAGIAQRLTQLQEKEQTSVRVKALFGLYVSASEEREQFLAWPDHVEEADLPADLSPRRSLAGLALALAHRALADHQPLRAEPYLLLASDLGLGDDARVARDLATVYAQTRRPQDLLALTEKFDSMLYGPDNALAHNELRDVYEYHVAVGGIFANSGAIPAAAMQLEKAIYAGDRLATESAESAHPFEVDPAVRQLYDAVRAKAMAANR